MSEPSGESVFDLCMAPIMFSSVTQGAAKPDSQAMTASPTPRL
jgi:hypothetical protein